MQALSGWRVCPRQSALLTFISLPRMIVEPDQRVADFAKAGSDIITVHAEQSATIHLHRLIGQVYLNSVFRGLCWSTQELAACGR